MSETHGVGIGGKNVPIGGVQQQHTAATGTTSGVNAGGTSRGGYRGSELKSDVEGTLESVKHKAEDLCHQAAHVCNNWRHYPKLLTSVLLLATFLSGALTAGLGSKLFGVGGPSYVTSHWNREAYDAHHALDVVLDHIKYPHLYESERGSSMIGQARSGIMDLIKGILPGGRSKMPRGGGMTDYAREAYEKSLGGRGMMDQAGDMMSDLAYKAKSTGYDIGHKLSDVAGSAKSMMGGGGYGESAYERMRQPKQSWTSKLFGGHDDTESTSWFGSTDDTGRQYKRGGGKSWMGGRDEDYGGDRDEFELATEKLKKVTRSADRNM